MGLAVNHIHQGDCVQQLAEITPGRIDLVFADPPFNIGYDYDVYDDDRNAMDYLDWSRSWMQGVFAALKPNGALWLAIGDEYAAQLKLAAQAIGFDCRSWVIWYYTFGVNCRRGFSRSHTHLFHFVKNPNDFTFNDDNPVVRVPSARQLVYADARANPKGRLPDNTWILRPQDLPGGFASDHDTWYFPRVAGTFKEREGFHGCQMPEQLLGRIIRISSNPTEVVLDPFAGSGTTLSVARKLGRQWIGIELSHDYARRIRERLKNIRVGDPLDGAADPLKSAPSTKNGKKRVVLPGSSSRRTSRAEKAAKIREAVNEAVVRAYAATHQGFSTDYLLANPELNAQFIDKCGQLETPGNATLWNQTLIRVRKQGKLPKLAKSGRRLSFRQMDDYSFAAEIALHLLSVNFDVTLDGILCDPALAEQFDQLARQFAPGYTSFKYRWAALTLRKRAKLAKQLAADYQQWLSDSLPRAKPLSSSSVTKCDAPGIYVLVGRDKLNLYVGETFHLGKRIQQISTIDAWRDLEPSGVRLFPQREQGLHGLKSVLIQRINPELNSRLLYPQLATVG